MLFRGTSSLSQLSYYEDVYEYFMPPDLMHDLCEGVAPCITFIVLNHLHKEHILTLSEINAAISSFDFPESGHIPTITTQNLIHHNWAGTANQKLWLLRMLPLIIGPLIDPHHLESDFWQLLLVGVKASQLLFSPCVLDEFQIQELNYFIGGILYYVFNLTDKPSARAKLHYLQHYPKFVAYCGPPTLYWCMRYESQHKYFKKLYKVTGNSINISKQFVYRFQLNLYIDLTNVPRYPIPLALSVISYEDVSSFANSISNLLNIDAPEFQLLTFQETKTLTYETFVLSVKKAIRIYNTSSETQSLQFGSSDIKCFQITKIVYVNSCWLLLGNLYDCHFDIMYNCYLLVAKTPHCMMAPTTRVCCGYVFDTHCFFPSFLQLK